MELTIYAFVLCVVGFVTATPYGYGTKGGAGAKADASAVAGAYSGVGDLPITFPGASGYSGSYSKASSSSFASSSASASSSSFSYSGANSGAYQGGAGALPGSSGCGSGTCQPGNKSPYGAASSGSQATDLSTGIDMASSCSSGNCKQNADKPSGSSSSGYSGGSSKANALATATAGESSQYSKGPSGITGCSGSTCGTPSNSDQGAASSYNDNDISKSPLDNTGCAGGKCGSPVSPNGNTEKCNNGNCNPSGYGSDDIYVPKNDKSSSPVGCSYGNCGPSSIGPNSTPVQNSPYQSGQVKCNTPGCAGNNKNPSTTPLGDSNLPPNYKPATYLTTPKEDNYGCYPPNCQNGSPINNVNYNVPASTGEKSSCEGGICNTGSKIPTTPVSSNYANPTLNIEGPCTSPNCANAGTHIKAPVSANIPSNCGADGKCGPQSGSGYGRPSNIQPQTYQPSQYQKPTQGNCAPGTPNCDSKLATSSPSQNERPTAFGSSPSATTPYGKPIGTSLSSIGTTGFNSNYGGNAGSYSQANAGTFGSTPSLINPASHPPGHYTPPGFVQPSNSVKPGYGGSYNSRPSAYDSAPNTMPLSPSAGAHGAGPGYGIPPSTFPSAPSAGAYGSKPGYGSSPSTFPSAPSGGAYGSRPGYGASPSAFPSAPSGGAYGSRPGYGASPSAFPSGPSGSAYNVGSTPQLPTLSAPSSNNCNTPDCASSSSGEGSLLPVKPSGVITPNKDLPYTGGFGAPPGLLKPNEFTVSQPILAKVPPVDSTKPSCTSGTCGQPSLPPTAPSYGHGASNSGAHATSSASANAVVYTGGFGGPPGFLKPYDNGKADIPAGKQKANAPSGLTQGKSFGGTPGYGSANSYQANSAAISNAAATTGSGAGYNDQKHKTGGCGGGCSGYGGSNGGQDYKLSGSYGNSGNGALTGSDTELAGANASAKSQANAVSSAGGYGGHGSYASSSATAHASAGAGIKGSYGK